MRLSWLAIVPAIMLVLCACEKSAPTSPVSSPDSPRIVALSPALAASLRELHLDDHLVGRHGYDAWSDPALPVCGDQAGIDYETLLRVRPTHVLVQWGTRQVPQRFLDLAQQQHWHVETIEPLSLDGVIDSGNTLAKLFNADAAPVERLKTACAPIEHLDTHHIGRIALLDWTSAPAGSYALLGPGSFHQQMLERIASPETSALTAGAPYVIMDQEDLLRLAPDAVIVFIPAQPGHATASLPTTPATRPPLFAGPQVDEIARRLQGIQGRETGEGDTKVTDRGGRMAVRIAVIDDPECLLPALNLARIAEQMRAILEHWSASDSTK